MTPTDHDPRASGGATSADEPDDAGADDRAVTAADESGTSDDLPRLPPRPERGGVPRSAARDEIPAPARGPTVVPVGARTALASDEYVEPELLEMARWNRLLVLGRVAAFGWATGVAVAALVVRSGAADGFDDGSAVTNLGRVGVPVAALVLILGWAWSDRRARNIKRLDGRLPSRVRCATAWLAPGLLTALLAIAIVPLEPGELLDIRPSIIVVVFTASLWRPYALLRRILATLIRTPSDALIGTAAVLDLAGFGLLWWQLTVWPSTITDATSGSVDTLVGVAFAAAIALGGNVVVWVYLLRATDIGEAHRLSSLQTRHEHRVLRLRGIDPTDPDVWWALVQRRVARQREQELQEQVRAPGPDRLEAHDPELLVERVRAEHATAFLRLGREGSAELVERLREQFSAALRAPHPEPVEQDLRDRFADALQTPRLTAASEATSSTSDPLASLKRRLGLTADGGEGSSDDALRRLLDQASLAQVEAALAERNDAASSDDDDAVRMAPPRLLWLDASRYLLLLAFAAVTGVGLWLVRQTLDGRTGAAGLLPLDLVDDADAARRAFVSAFTIGLALVPLRAAVVSDHARRAGVPDTHERRLLATFAVVAAIAAISFVIDGDERGTVSLLLQVPAVALAVWSASAIAPIRRWFGLRTVALTAWAAGLPVLLVASWIGRLQRPVEATDSLQVMAFFAVIVAIVAGVVAVVLALSAADQDDAIRLSPELAVRADSLRR